MKDFEKIFTSLKSSLTKSLYQILIPNVCKYFEEIQVLSLIKIHLLKVSEILISKVCEKILIFENFEKIQNLKYFEKIQVLSLTKSTILWTIGEKYSSPKSWLKF